MKVIGLFIIGQIVACSVISTPAADTQRDSSAAAIEQFREELRDRAQEELAQRRLSVIEIRRRLPELCDRLQSHRELLEAARESRTEARKRRGGD